MNSPVKITLTKKIYDYNFRVSTGTQNPQNVNESLQIEGLVPMGYLD